MNGTVRLIDQPEEPGRPDGCSAVQLELHARESLRFFFWETILRGSKSHSIQLLLAVGDVKKRNEELLMIVTIAIPTFNRVRCLCRALESINNLCVPNGVDLRVAISNTQSGDATFDYLNDSARKNQNYLIINSKTCDIPNWVALSSLVPRDTDWVWLHGDDDQILDQDALSKILNTLFSFKHLQPVLLSIPQAKRSSSTSTILSDTLFQISNQIGFHEMLGWMSQLFLSGRAYFEMMSDYAQIFGDACTTSVIHQRSIGNFPHSQSLMNRFWNQQALFWDVPLIDEQVSEIDKKSFFEARKKLEFKQNFHFTDRFFFDAIWQIKFFKHNNLLGSASFFRYVNKLSWDVLINIIIEEMIEEPVPGRIAILDKIDIVRSLIYYLDDPLLNKYLLLIVNLLELQFKTSSQSNFDSTISELLTVSRRPVFPFNIVGHLS